MVNKKKDDEIIELTEEKPDEILSDEDFEGDAGCEEVHSFKIGGNKIHFSNKIKHRKIHFSNCRGLESLFSFSRKTRRPSHERTNALEKAKSML